MPNVITSGSICKCSFGSAPMPFNVIPTNMTFSNELTIATIMDYIPILNIPTFGACLNPTNITKVCVPTVITPWTPTDPNVLVKGIPILTQNSLAFCSLWSGIIQFISSSQFTIST